MFQVCTLYYFISHNCQLNANDCPHARSKIMNLWGNCDRHLEQSIPRCAAWLKFHFCLSELPPTDCQLFLGCNGRWRHLKLSSFHLFKSFSYCCHSCLVICALGASPGLEWRSSALSSLLSETGADLVSEAAWAVLMQKSLLGQCVFKGQQSSAAGE